MSTHLSKSLHFTKLSIPIIFTEIRPGFTMKLESLINIDIKEFNKRGPSVHP